MKKKILILLFLFINLNCICLAFSERTGESYYNVNNEENLIVLKDDEEDEISQLNQKVEELQSQIDIKEEDIENLNNQIESKENEILSLQEENKNTWITCIIIFFIGVYIAYKVGKDKSK